MATTPLQSIRRYCLWCSLDQANEVRLCQSPQCGLYPYRLGRMPGTPGQSCLKAIRARCLDCVCWSTKEVAICKTPYVLNPFRIGKNPNYGESGRTKARLIMRERMKKTTDDKPIQRQERVGQGEVMFLPDGT
jgi:hypothetical protein